MGVLTATYTLDGATIPKIHNTTSAFVSQEEPNFLHYSIDNLPPGDHTLVGNITVANNHTFALDYITYNPSFDTLLTMPLLGNTTSTSTSGPTRSSQPQTPGASQSLVAVAVLGALIGVLALLLLAILGRWLFLRSRKVKQTDSDDPPPFSDEYHHQPDNGMLFKNYSRDPRYLRCS